MDINVVTLVYHFRGRWVHTPNLQYIEGNEMHEDLDIDFLSFTHMLKKYREDFNVNVTKIYYQIAGETDTSLSCMENDDGLKELVKTVMESTSREHCVHIYPWEESVGYAPVLSTQSSVVNQTENEGEELMDSELDWGFVTSLELGDVDIDDDGGDGDGDGDGEGDAEDDGDVEIDESKNIVKFDETNPNFVLGMTFGDAKEARLAITKYSVANSTPLKLNPNEPLRLRAKCLTANCPFHLYISRDGKSSGLMVKTFNEKHTCLKNANNILASAKFIAHEFKKSIYQNPRTTGKHLKFEAEQKMKVYVSKYKCRRAKKMVLKEMEGSYVSEFGYLSAYVDTLKRSNPGSTAELELCEESLTQGRFVFKRLYICFDALKKGWRAGCRPIIGLDGCHLKGIVKGQILVAVGKDGADQLFPVAWAVVSKENKENWIWFIQLLAKDLEIQHQEGHLTIISDMQKGLVQAVIDVLPAAEHRYCARHIHANWSKKWRSKEMRKKFWIVSWSTYKEEFEDNLKRLGDISKHAATDLVKYNPSTFCRAFFSTRCKSPMVDNNICESFNSTILDARHKPIVSMLDDIRVDAMKRLAAHKKLVEKWTSEWSHKCMVNFGANMEAAVGCRVVFNGAHGYEIGDGDDRHTVCLQKCICTCRAWELSGIPCPHAICAFQHCNIDPIAFISDWYHKSKYIAAYEYAKQPMPGKQMMNCDAFEALEPPHVVTLVGRPRVVRIRSQNEPMKGKTSAKLSKKGSKITCSVCSKEGHNQRSCPSKPSQVSSTTEVNENLSSTSKAKGNVTAPSKENRKMAATTSNGKEKVASTCRKTRRTIGLGIYVDQATGNTTLNPGMSSETIITQRDPISSQPLPSSSDPVTKFPIPNEREIREEHRSSMLSKNSGTRRIAFAGDGRQVISPQNLPFKPPGLQWKGNASITTTQLHREMDKKRDKTGDVNQASKS